MLSRTSRILLGLALVAAVTYFVINRSARRPPEADDARLVPLDVHRADAVVLNRPGETLRFARAESTWTMTEPVFDTAERSTIVSLLDALEHADIARDLGATDDLKPFGLDPAQLSVTVLAGADTLLDLALGKRTVDDAWCYARRTHEHDLLLVPTGIARAASLPRDAYRNRRVIDFQLDRVETYQVRTADRTMVWFRTAEGQNAVWVDNEHERGDSVAVLSILRRLRGLRVASFPSDSGTEPGQVFGTITVWQTRRATPTEITFFRASDGTDRATDRATGRTVVVEGEVGDLFAHTATELRDRRLLQFSPPDAARIDVVLPGASGAIVRSGGAWSFPNPALGRVDPERAADFVRALRSLKWTVLPGKGAPESLDAARLSITVTGDDGTILDEMRAAARAQGLWYVTSRSSRGIWMVDGALLTALADQFVKLKTP